MSEAPVFAVGGNEFHTVPRNKMSVNDTLPKDAMDAALVGRVWRPGLGPSVVRIEPNGSVIDITGAYPTVSALCEEDHPAAALRAAKGSRIGSISDILAHTPMPGDSNPYLLSPIDLQAVKAAGVTFVESMIERVVEETLKGDPAGAAAKRAEIWSKIKTAWDRITGNSAPDDAAYTRLKAELIKLKPGSPQAEQLIDVLTSKEIGLPSTYLKVGFGKEPEIFSKAQPLMTVGSGSRAGYNAKSKWTNPEPEVVSIVNSKGVMVGAALGNDVNDREMEGISPLLLNRAKDRNGTAAVGPFVRLFDDKFTVDDVRKMDVGLRVEDKEGREIFNGVSSMAKISRDINDELAVKLAERAYPTGAVLYNGTMTVPNKDRLGAGLGFTHLAGDRVDIFSDKLGRLTNVMVDAQEVKQGREHDLYQLMESLAQRGVFQAEGPGRAGVAPRRLGLVK